MPILARNIPMVRVAYSAGQVIQDAGGAGSVVLCVATGLVKCVKYLPNGEQRILRLAKPGDMIGIELLWDRAYRHRTYALMETEILRIPLAKLKLLAQEDPDFCLWLGGRWSHVLNEAERWILDFATGALQEKIARLILYLVDGRDAQEEVPLLKRSDMAAILGVACESVCRIMGDFQKQGVLTNVRANRYLCDYGKLAALASRAR
ncbi:Crp/Fnr family transcriptional regulator [Methylomagnum sp.]